MPSASLVLALTGPAWAQSAPPPSEAPPATLQPPGARTGPAGKELLVTFGALYGGYAGGETGYLIGEALEDDEQDHTGEGIVPGALGGSAIGLGTAYLLSLSNDSSIEAQTLLYTASTHGIFYGAQLGQMLIPPGDPGRTERIHAAGLAGSMLGVGGAIAFGDAARSSGDQARYTLASGVGWLTATGINDLASVGARRNDTDDDGLPNYRFDPRPRAAVNIGTAAVFGGLGMLANRGKARPGIASTSLSIGHGAWIGGWSPLLFTDDPSASEITGGLRLGAGIGYGSSLLMAALGEPSARSAGLQVAGWAAGSALGAGLPLSLEGEGPAATVVGPMLAAGIGGQVLGAVVAPAYDLEPNDAVLLGTLGAWTSYQAIGWGLYGAATQDSPRRPFGYALTTSGAGSLLTLGLTPFLDVSPSGSLMLLSGGGWGTWYGGWGAQLLDADTDEVWLTTLASGNGALVATGLVQAAGWQPSWADVAAIDGLGLVGAAAGGLVGVVFLYDEDNLDPLIYTTLGGSTAGLVAGVVMSATNDDSAKPPKISLRSRNSRWRPTLSASPVAGRDGSTGAMVRLQLHEEAR
ncbi:MAG: hypothetical protein KTR31_25595 [Myxococcales bacterium]|nr:hypothetical protein [Myxococcales bacterium]